MNKKSTISDEEIQHLMDFDSLLKQNARLNSRTSTIKRGLFLIGLLAVSVCIFKFWPDKIANDQPAQQSSAQVSQVPNVTEKVKEQIAIPQNQELQKLMPIVKTPAKPKENVSIISSAPSYFEAEPIKGFPHLYNYLNTQIIYPVSALKDSIEGVESVSFVIDEKGKVAQIAILKSLGKDFDGEAIRLLENMPAWKPALLNNKPVDSKISLPLTFTIQKPKKGEQ